MLKVINYLLIYRARRRLIPSLPTDFKETQRIISDFELRTKFGKSVTLNNETGNFLILTTKKNLELLTLSNYLYVDGTFDYCVKFFTQLFTLHGYFNGHYVPHVYCLLENKKTSKYH